LFQPGPPVKAIGAGSAAKVSHPLLDAVFRRFCKGSFWRKCRRFSGTGTVSSGGSASSHGQALSKVIYRDERRADPE
jgi:hypothetical protein